MHVDTVEPLGLPHQLAVNYLSNNMHGTAMQQRPARYCAQRQQSTGLWMRLMSEQGTMLPTSFRLSGGLSNQLFFFLPTPVDVGPCGLCQVSSSCVVRD